MNKSRLSLVISLAALLGGGLVLPNAASAHDRTPTFKVEREHHQRHDGDRYRHHNPQWYLQRHYEARYYDERPLKRRHKHEHKHGHKHDYKVRRHHYRDTHRNERRVYQPAPVEHEYRRISPLRLQIGYEIVL